MPIRTRERARIILTQEAATLASGALEAFVITANGTASRALSAGVAAVHIRPAASAITALVTIGASVAANSATFTLSFCLFIRKSSGIFKKASFAFRACVSTLASFAAAEAALACAANSEEAVLAFGDRATLGTLREAVRERPTLRH